MTESDSRVSLAALVIWRAARERGESVRAGRVVVSAIHVRRRLPGVAGAAGIRCCGHLVVAYDRAVDSPLIVRPARVQDVRQMACVHVAGRTAS